MNALMPRLQLEMPKLSMKSGVSPHSRCSLQCGIIAQRGKSFSKFWLWRCFNSRVNGWGCSLYLSWSVWYFKSTTVAAWLSSTVSAGQIETQPNLQSSFGVYKEPVCENRNSFIGSGSVNHEAQDRHGDETNSQTSIMNILKTIWINQ